MMLATRSDGAASVFTRADSTFTRADSAFTRTDSAFGRDKRPYEARQTLLKSLVNTTEANLQGTPGEDLDPLPSPRLPPRKVDRHHHGLATTAYGLNVSIPKNGRQLSLRQLKAVLSTVIDAKREKDTRCVVQDLYGKTETMEQHLYGFLRTRYRGQHVIVQEWVQAINRGIMRYSSVDSHILAFYHILRNELPESFPPILDTLGAQIDVLTKKLVNEKNSSVGVFAMDAIYRAVAQAGMTFSECNYIVRHIYCDADADDLMDEVEQRIHEARHVHIDEQTGEPLVSINDIKQGCYRKQVKLMNDYLAEFVQTFSEIDDDQDGILSATELVSLMERLMEQVPSPNARVAEIAKIRLMQRLRGRRFATFSQCSSIYEGLISAVHLDSKFASSSKHRQSDGESFPMTHMRTA